MKISTVPQRKWTSYLVVLACLMSVSPSTAIPYCNVTSSPTLQDSQNKANMGYSPRNRSLLVFEINIITEPLTLYLPCFHELAKTERVEVLSLLLLLTQEDKLLASNLLKHQVRAVINAPAF